MADLTSTPPARRVEAPPPGTEAHQFTLRDDNRRHYHRPVRVAVSPYFVALAWRASASAPVHPLGTYRLDLPALLAAGYVRPDRRGDESEVRVRFYRGDDGGIYLQPRLAAPALLVARAPLGPRAA